MKESKWVIIKKNMVTDEVHFTYQKTDHELSIHIMAMVNQGLYEIISITNLHI